MRNEAIAAIREAVFKGTSGADVFNVDRMDAAEHTPAEIVDAANQLPIHAPARLLIVRRAEHLLRAPSERAARAASRAEAADDDPLVRYFRNPCPSTCLVLLGEKPDARLRVTRAMSAAGVLCELASPKDEELADWLVKEARRLGKRLGPGAAERLVNFSGNELAAAAGELEKLALFVGEAPEIESADVEAAVADRQGAIVWAFTDALKARDSGTALETLARYLGGFRRLEDAFFPLVGTLRSELRILLQAKEANEQKGLRGRALADALARTLRVHPLRAEKAGRAASRFSKEELLAALRRLLHADRRLKSGSIPPRILLDAWVWRLCARAESTPVTRNGRRTSPRNE